MRTLTLLLALTACDEAGVLATGDDSADPPAEDTDAPLDDDTDVPPDTDSPPDPVDLPPPTPAAPCTDDLDADNGALAPDLGVPSRPGAFEGDPGEDGPFQVVRRNASLRNPFPGRDRIAITSYAPSTDGEGPAPGPFPLVLVMPGFGYKYAGYEHFILPLVSHGFVVVGMDFPNAGFLDPAAHDKSAAEASSVIDWALTEGPHVANIDATKVAAMGHSFGGKIAFYAASLDERIDLAIGWDPQNSGGPPCFLGDLTGGSCNDFPVAPNCEADDPGRMHLMHAETLVFATEDETITPDAHLRAWNFYRGAPSPASYVHFGSAGHAAWTTNGDISALTRRVHTAVLLSRLGGWRGLNDWLPGGGWLDSQRLVDDHRTK